MTRLLTLCLMISFAAAGWAQNHVCGLPGGEEDTRLIERLKKNKEHLRINGSSRSLTTRYVPVVVHNIRRSDGSGGLSVTRIYDQMCSLNEYYAEQEADVQFYLQEINEIHNNTAYSNHYGVNGTNILSNNKRSKVINIYIPETANTSTQSLGVTLGYYSPSQDWIVLRPSEVSKFSTTLHHEMGHYFSLPHPFRGWDYEAYDPDIHGEQVGTYAPSTYNTTLILNEKQDMSNCETAADLICDTPPDYNHFSVDWGCNYSGGAKDPNGDFIDPDETNVMSYFNSCSPQTFTTDQIEVINTDLTRRANNGSLNLVTAPTGNISTTADLLLPEEGEVVADNSAIFFDWEDIEFATEYIIEIDRIVNFGFMPQRAIVSESELLFYGNDLNLNLTYYWRVRGINEYEHCSGWSEIQTFKTNAVSSVNTIASVQQFAVQPNPIALGEKINIMITSDAAFDANIRLVNINGAVINVQRNERVLTGNNTIPVTTSDLSSGIYFVQLISEQGTLQEKIVIQ